MQPNFQQPNYQPRLDTERIEFRCENKLHGVRKEYPDGSIFFEVRCKDSWCVDRQAGEVVFHYFDWVTGVLDHNKRFKDPTYKRINGRAESSEKVNRQYNSKGEGK